MSGGEERFQHSGGPICGRVFDRDGGGPSGVQGLVGECGNHSVGGRIEQSLWCGLCRSPVKPGLDCVSWWGGVLGAREWGLEGGPRKGTAVGIGEMAWGGREEWFHGQEGWWGKLSPPGKWGAIVELHVGSRAAIAMPFLSRQPGLLGKR